MSYQIKGHLQVILGTLIIAGSFIATADIASELHPVSLNLMRFCMAVLLMFPFVIGKKDFVNKFKSVFPRSMIISFFYCTYFTCNFAAMLSTTTLKVGSIYTLTPLVTAIFSIFVFKQRMKLRNIPVYLLGMLGTIWVIFEGDLKRFLEMDLNKGDMIFGVGVLCMSGYIITLKLLCKKEDNITIMTFGNLLGGVVWMSLVTLFADIDLGWGDLERRYYPSMAYLAIAATFITSYLYQKASTTLSPVNVSSYIYLNPLCVALLSIFLFHESVEIKLLPGIVASTLATFIIQYIERPKET